MEAAKKIKFTYQDYLLTPEDKRYELIEGDLFMTPSPTWNHQTISTNLYEKLNDFVKKNKLGFVRFAPIDVVLSDEDVIQPDILFISHERKNRITKENVRGAPDLVVEIISPGTENRDKVIKKKLYGRYGAIEMWIVDSNVKTIELIGWEGSQFKTLQTFPQNSTFESPLLKDFCFPVKEIFTDIF